MDIVCVCVWLTLFQLNNIITLVLILKLSLFGKQVSYQLVLLYFQPYSWYLKSSLFSCSIRIFMTYLVFFLASIWNYLLYKYVWFCLIEKSFREKSLGARIHCRLFYVRKNVGQNSHVSETLRRQSFRL